MSGSPATSTPEQVHPGQFPPGYGWSKNFFDQVLPQIMKSPYPTFQGDLDPGMSPTAGAAMRHAQRYMETPMSNSFGRTMGSIGQFQNPSFESPQGYNQPPPDYGFNINPMQQPPQMMGAMQQGTPSLPTSAGGNPQAPWNYGR